MRRRSTLWYVSRQGRKKKRPVGRRERQLVIIRTKESASCSGEQGRVWHTELQRKSNTQAQILRPFLSWEKPLKATGPKRKGAKTSHLLFGCVCLKGTSKCVLVEHEEEETHGWGGSVNTLPGPLALPGRRRPSLKTMALSYSRTTCRGKQKLGLRGRCRTGEMGGCLFRESPAKEGFR